MHELNSASFLTAREIAWRAVLKKTKIKLDLLTNIDMSLMAEKVLRDRICRTIQQYAKANSKYMKDQKKQKKLKNHCISSIGTKKIYMNR